MVYGWDRGVVINAGASVAELDIEEFFVKEFENTASPRRLSQALHLHDNENRQSGNQREWVRTTYSA